MAGTESIPTLGAVIVAAGSSRRMGFDKVLTPICGEPLIRYSLRAFESCEAVREIVIVCARERETDVREALVGFSKITDVVTGGEARQDSVWNGLGKIESEYIAVHDAARPLVTATLITRCLEAAIEHGASTAAEPVTDTVQRSDEHGCCAEVIDRDGLWRMQTPQIFRTSELRRAVEGVRASGAVVTDETSALRRLGGHVFLVENAEWNFKVTYPRDVTVAEFILQSRAAASLT